MRRRVVQVGWIAVAAFVTVAASRPAPASPVVRYRPAGTPTAAVIVLAGLSEEHAAVTVGRQPFRSFVAKLNEHGVDVLVPDLPAAGPGMAQRLAGVRDVAGYRQLWERRVRNLVADVRVDDGPVPVGVVGVSWGGLHALLAACDVGGFAAVAVHAPVTRASILTEFRSGALDGLDPTDCRYDDPMWVSWGTHDTRVGWHATERLASRVGAAGGGYDLGHQTSHRVLDDLGNWMLAVLRSS